MKGILLVYIYIYIYRVYGLGFRAIRASTTVVEVRVRLVMENRM